MFKIKFGDLRKKLSTIDRISICYKETLQYENFMTIKDVPDTYNDLTVYGIGMIESEFYKINDFEYSTDDKSGNLVLLPCIEIVVFSNEELQETTDYDKMEIGSVVKMIGKDELGIVKEIEDKLKYIVDIWYKKDDYLAEPDQQIVNYNEIIIANDNDYRVGYLKYLSRWKYLNGVYGRGKERMSAILYQLKKAWETFPDLRLGQLIAYCCSNYSLVFNIEDEELMKLLQKLFIDNFDQKDKLS